MAAITRFFIAARILLHARERSPEAKLEDLVAAAADLFEMLRNQKLGITVNQRYPLREVTRAHAQIEAGQTTGSSILLVD